MRTGTRTPGSWWCWAWPAQYRPGGQRRRHHRLPGGKRLHLSRGDGRDGTLFYQYGISAYPTTFMIDTEGNVFGYVQGAVSREVMDDIVEQTRTGQRR